MDITSPKVIKFLCGKYNIRPQKQRGQNFLIDKEILNKIIKAAGLKKDDVILEIGPGFGVLTAELAKRVKRVIAVELDKRLVAAFREIWSSEAKLRAYKNVELVRGDILKFSIFNFQFSNYKYKIVANLPYQITSAVLRKFLEHEPRPSEMIVMVQKEVAERICAQVGEMSLLSISVQFFGKPEIVSLVPKTSFWPVPEVDSAILKISQIRIRSSFALNSLSDSGITQKKFFQVVKLGFSARRKQLHNNLAGGLRMSNQKVKEVLINLGFDPKARAQDLSVGDWIKLVNQLAI